MGNDEKMLTMQEVRDRLRNVGEAGWSAPNYEICGYMADSIDSYLASQPAEQPMGEPLVNRQDIRSVCRAIDGLKDRLFDANALDAEALALHKAGCDAILRIGDVALEVAQPKPEQAVGDGVVPDVFMQLLNFARRVPNFTGIGNEHSCTDAELNDAVESCDEWLATTRPAVATPADGMDEIYAWLRKRDLMQNAAEEGEYQVSDIIAALDDHEAALLLSNPSTPAEVTDEMCSAAIIEFNKPSKGLQQDSMLSKARRCLRAALTAQCQVRKDGQVMDETRLVAEEGLAYFEKAGDEGDKLYVQAIRASLASPSAGAEVPEELIRVAMEANDMCRSAFQVAERVATQYATVYAGTNFGALHEQLKKSLDRQHQVLKPYREAMLAAAPEVPRA